MINLYQSIAIYSRHKWNSWLVVLTILKNMSSSMGRIIYPIFCIMDNFTCLKPPTRQGCSQHLFMADFLRPSPSLPWLVGCHSHLLKRNTHSWTSQWLYHVYHSLFPIQTSINVEKTLDPQHKKVDDSLFFQRNYIQKQATKWLAIHQAQSST